MRSYIRIAAAGLAAALAAWISQTTIALATADGPRIVLLPLSGGAVATCFAAAVAVALLVAAGAPLRPLALFGFLALAWLPFDVPPAFLIWSGPLTLLIWVAVVWIMVRAIRLPRLPDSVSPAVRAGVVALLVFGAAAWRAAPAVPGGDEPHYLVITQSLLYDGDLRIENNHRRGDYQAYVGGQLRPDYLRRGRDGEIYSIHAPGLSALVLPAFAVGGYPATVVFLLLLSAAGAALLWRGLWLATRDSAASWFGWAAVIFSSTQVFHTFTVYPDGVAGLLTLTGLLALLRAADERRTGSRRLMPWLMHGAALALLPWLHTRFALLAGTLGSLILLRLGRVPNPAAKAAVFLAAPAVSAVGWIGYFVAIYGTADPAAPYGSADLGSLANIPGGFAGLMFDHRFGLLANAPVLAFSAVGLVAMLRDRWPSVEDRSPEFASPPPGSRRLAVELLCVAVPYLMTVTNFTMWWAGWSAPARFAAPLMPILGVTTAFAWLAIGSRATRTLAVGALGMTAFITSILVIPERGRLAFNTRMAPGLWLGWASPLADLPAGVPDWFRQPQGGFLVDAALWLTFLTLGWVVLRALARTSARWKPGSFSTLAAALFLGLSMLALTAVWARYSADGLTRTTAQMAALRRLAREPALVPLRIAPPGPLARGEVPSLMRIVSPTRLDGGGRDRDDNPLLVLPAVPAGQYRLHPRATGSGGRLMVGVRQDQFTVRTEALRDPMEPLLMDLPVDVRALIVRGDERARQVVRRVDVEPVSLRPARSVPTTEFARQAVRYGAAVVYFADDRSYPEPEAFWIGGSREASVVVQPDRPVTTVPLLLRNAPVRNDIVVASGSWRTVMQLAPGEERRVEVPFETAAGAILIRFDVASGFRPSEVDRDSRDERFLGVWVQLEL